MEDKIINKITEYIEANEETRQLILSSIANPSLRKKSVGTTDEEKIKVAYALNMCTVSISQIIDYDDINVLEQEYETILNNLNLEQIPKDEALLQILKQLLDTITYFRIEEGEKEMIEKEYQQKIKNAIWTAIPNFGLIVAGGKPMTMAISLASQVGIGYMNYRRNKVEYGIELERKNWELQKTAIEQFNGLRRELFDTAWRLADAYGFPDGYRLTEKQITQYNRILMDQDEMRKYERLESIKEDFEAYPPFWYFIGNVANYISRSSDLALTDETRLVYRDKALEYFEKYQELNRFNIMREDQLAASCALEYADLLLLDNNTNVDKVNELIDSAVKTSKNQNDILELCAIAYLKIGEQKKASRILRLLVNEDYNSIINAQLLSSIYVYEHNRIDYEILSSRIDVDYLYPMPQDNEDLEILQAEFGGKQKSVLKMKYKIVLDEFLDKYVIEWNKITSIFDNATYYSTSFFLDTPKAKAERRAQARRVFANVTKRERYQQRMREIGYELNLLDILNEMVTNLFDSPLFSDYTLEQEVKDEIRRQIINKKDDINQLQEAMNRGEFMINAYFVSQTITLRQIVENAFRLISHFAMGQIEAANINEISYMESNLILFCLNNELEQPAIIVNKDAETIHLFDKTKEPFTPQLFGANAVAQKKNAEFVTEMTMFIKEKMSSIDLKNTQTSIYFSGYPEFNGYFMSTTFVNHPDVRGHALMILKDNTNRKFDLVFTTDGIVSIVKDRVKSLTPYGEVKLKSDAILLYRNEIVLTREYKTLSFDVNILFDIIKQLGSRFVKNIDEKVEYIEGTITPKLLNKWFVEKEEAMATGVTKIYAVPTDDVLDHLGYHFEDNLDEEKNLLQYFYDNNSGDILGLRVVRFDSIDSNFQAVLFERNGMIKVN
ncbi:MAG: hypothetical protein K6G76_03285 [Lachnospiraceae bacterium]|nr:hypothetical protein [Lachnospiraceae bacterium]